MKTLTYRILLTLVSVFLTVKASAQSDVVLSGVITDTDGQPLPGASVTLLESKTPLGWRIFHHDSFRLSSRDIIHGIHFTDPSRKDVTESNHIPRRGQQPSRRNGSRRFRNTKERICSRSRGFYQTRRTTRPSQVTQQLHRRKSCRNHRSADLG